MAVFFVKKEHEPHVKYLDDSVPVEQESRRFDVAMNEAAFKGVLQALGDLDDEAACFREWHGAVFFHVFLKTFALHIFHGQVMNITLMINVESTHNVVMIEKS